MKEFFKKNNQCTACEREKTIEFTGSSCRSFKRKSKRILTLTENKIFTQITDSRSLPTLPHILLKLIEACNNPNTTLKELAKIIATDPSISEKLLHLVNSAQYGLKNHISSIDQALLLLGIVSVKNVAVSASIYRVFHKTQGSDLFNLKQFWWHSLSCGAIARRLANQVRYPSPDEAFLSGLLHDIGKILWSNFQREYAKILESAGRDLQKLLAGEAAFGVTHAVLGGWLIDQWNIRSFLPDAIRFHHDSEQRIKDAFPLVQIVYVANRLCSLHEESQADRFAAARRLLNVQQDEAAQILEKAHLEVRDIAASLNMEIEAPGEAIRYSSRDRKKDDELTALVQEISLLQNALGGLLEASSAKDVLGSIQTGLQSLFEVGPMFFFLLQDDQLVSQTVLEAENFAVLEGLTIPLTRQSSLLVQSVEQQAMLASVGDRAETVLSILDEQLIRVLGCEGMLCIPLSLNRERLGVLVVGGGVAQLENLLARRRMLDMFVNQAVLALKAHWMKEFQRAQVQEERLAASSAMARKIVHEVHNPLGIINNYLNLLGAKLTTDEELLDDLRIIKEEIKRVSLLVSELSSFSTHNTQELEPVDINRVILDLVKISRESIWQKAKVQVHLNLDAGLPRVASEKNRLKQVLINLIKNAVEAMPDGGNIFIETLALPRRQTLGDGSPEAGKQPPQSLADETANNVLRAVEIKIRDDGPGIPEDLSAHMFEPFVSSKGHDGLGLSIVYHWVKELGGNITCESKAKVGTVFTIIIPIR
jgi:HD-like signal output (HDOD) protein/signal transduction histidine kinase